jgi:type II restriction enzyme
VSGVRERFLRLRPLQRQRWYNRGWTMDVLNILRALEKRDFLLAEVYRHAHELRELHPRNRHVEPKIRQQLQRLRDLGFLEFLGRGRYRLKR